MNTLVPRDHDFAREQCINAAFLPLGEPTDWDAVIAHAADLDVDALTAELRSGEPYADTALNRLTVFRLNTKIRIALRHAKHRPQYGTAICSSCGARHTDPVLSASWAVGRCVYCEESSHLIYSQRGLDWGGGLRLAFDTSNNTWGIAYTSTSDRDSYRAGIVVTGYPSRVDAYVALQASDYFISLYNQSCKEGTEVSADEVLPIGKLFSLDLPLSPSGWRAFLTECMRSAGTQNSEPYSRAVTDTIREYFRAGR